MSKVIVSLSMSLDGFIAGPNVSAQQPLGEGGERLHDWLFKSKNDVDVKVMDEITETSGAVIVGGTTYKLGIDGGWGGISPFKMRAFVLTHRIPKEKVKGFTFNTEGIQSIITEAKKEAGIKNIWVMGGANVIQQFIKARLVDEIQISLVNILMGKGIRLFDKIDNGQIELEKERVGDSTGVTHLKFSVVNKK